jgi:hypothetical protein
MKKPPTISGVVPTYGRRLFTSIYAPKVQLFPDENLFREHLRLSSHLNNINAVGDV